MPEDQRMLFLRNLEASRAEDSITTEYQVIADANIVGEVAYGPYYFTIWEITDKPPGEERLLCLGVRQPPSWKDESWRSATKSGFFHGGGVASELVALAALFLRRRLRLGAQVRMGDKPSMITVDKGWTDIDLVRKSSSLADLKDGFRLAAALNPSLHQSFILAAKLYQQALELVEVKPDLAYLNLVSAIEAVAAHHGAPPKVSLEDWDKELADVVSRVPDSNLRSQIEKSVLKNKFVARRFVDFVVAYTELEFWTSPARPRHGRVKKQQLPELLKRIYRQRSKTLHDGEPFPPYACEPPIMGEEIPAALDIRIGERKWTPKEYIPHVRFFERLVNHVLLNFAKSHQCA